MLIEVTFHSCTICVLQIGQYYCIYIFYSTCSFYSSYIPNKKKDGKYFFLHNKNLHFTLSALMIGIYFFP